MHPNFLLLHFQLKNFAAQLWLVSAPTLSFSLSLSLKHTHSLSTFLDVLFSHSISLTHKPSLELHAQVSERERMRKKKMVERVRESVCALWSNCGKSIYCWIACNGIKRGFILAAQIELQTQKKGFHLIFLSLNGPVEIFSSSKKCGDQFSE